MSSRVLPYPLFDADNHLYETQDAFTRYLPREYASAIQYVQINGRTKIAVDVLTERTKLSEEDKAKVMGGNLARLIAA